MLTQSGAPLQTAPCQLPKAEQNASIINNRCLSSHEIASLDPSPSSPAKARLGFQSKVELSSQSSCSRCIQTNLFIMRANVRPRSSTVVRDPNVFFPPTGTVHLFLKDCVSLPLKSQSFYCFGNYCVLFFKNNCVCLQTSQGKTGNNLVLHYWQVFQNYLAP